MSRTVKELLEELEDKDPDMPIEQAVSFGTKIYLHEIYERECDEEDCISYLTDNGYGPATKNTDFMDMFVTRYRHKFDSEYGTWDNIASTVFYFKDELADYQSDDDEPDEKDDDAEM